MNLWNVIAAQIGDATGVPFELRERRSAAGGCINSAWIVGDGVRLFFVKTNVSEQIDMFEAEAEGLAELARSRTVRVPRVIAQGTVGRDAFLVLEQLTFGGASADERLGRELASLHRTTSKRFGWHRENTIGSTPQHNNWSDDWLDFLRRHRIGYQLDLAAERGAGRRLRVRGEELIERLPHLFRDYQPVPSLLHGDLWGGNAAVLISGEPVIFDPATYYGDRESDLAMTELFGGFGRRFYAAYQESWALDPGYATRKTLYNLYHVLNHFNLFGGGYGAQAEDMLDRLLSELR